MYWATLINILVGSDYVRIKSVGRNY
jgi:hypothetical protein